MNSVGVIHLVWVPAGLAPLERFLASYASCPGGVEHDLVVIFNGHKTRQELAAFMAKLRDVPHAPLILDRPNQDLTSYRLAALAHTNPYLCFLNSYTELRDPLWLAKMMAHITRPGVGVAGASGSWQSFTPPLAHERARLAGRGLGGRLRGQLRLAYQRARYPAFPNPHIRSNGFLIARDLLLQLNGMTPRSKAGAWRFENFRHNMTRQIQARGLRPLVVGRDGVGYEIEDWPRSNTYRQGDQANLLLTDNRTQDYETGTNDERCSFWIGAWQERALPPTPVDASRAPHPALELQHYAPLSALGSAKPSVSSQADGEPSSHKG